MEGVILALDQGTTNTKALLVHPGTGRPIFVASSPVGISFPAPGWVEQDAAQLWDATFAAITECLQAHPEARVLSIAISNQRESVVCWDRRSGEPVGSVLGWQDARTERWCANLQDGHPGLSQVIRSRTGLSLDPMFSAPKMR